MNEVEVLPGQMDIYDVLEENDDTYEMAKCTDLSLHKVIRHGQADMISKLREENKRYREALEWYSENSPHGNIADEALEESE